MKNFLFFMIVLLGCWMQVNAQTATKNSKNAGGKNRSQSQSDKYLESLPPDVRAKIKATQEAARQRTEDLKNSRKAGDKNAQPAEGNNSNPGQIPVLPGILNVDAKPASVYSFDKAVIYKITTNGSRGDFSATQKVRFSSTQNAVGKTMERGGKYADITKDIDLFIQDYNKQAGFMFFKDPDENKKYYMAMPIQGDVSGGEEYANLTVSRTNGSRTVMGYVCDGYEVLAGSMQLVVWISRDQVTEFNTFKGKMEHLVEGFPTGIIKAALSDHTFWGPGGSAGRLALAFDGSIKPGEYIDFEFIRFNRHDIYPFSTCSYEDVKDTMGR